MSSVPCCNVLGPCCSIGTTTRPHGRQHDTTPQCTRRGDGGCPRRHTVRTEQREQRSRAERARGHRADQPATGLPGTLRRRLRRPSAGDTLLLIIGAARVICLGRRRAAKTPATATGPRFSVVGDRAERDRERKREKSRSGRSTPI